MENNYHKIVQDNLNLLYNHLPADLAEKLPAKREGEGFTFKAFGALCRIGPRGITLDDVPQTGVLGILISLYALNTGLFDCRVEPMKAFKDFPNSMPYVGAFCTHTEQILLPRVESIKAAQKKIVGLLNAKATPAPSAGDFSFTVYPLPKVALGYIFYEADEDFPASVTCLYSSNANLFLPMDALADVGEYTSKAILNFTNDLSA